MSKKELIIKEMIPMGHNVIATSAPHPSYSQVHPAYNFIFPCPPNDYLPTEETEL